MDKTKILDYVIYEKPFVFYSLPLNDEYR